MFFSETQNPKQLTQNPMGDHHVTIQISKLELLLVKTKSHYSNLTLTHF